MHPFVSGILGIRKSIKSSMSQSKQTENERVALNLSPEEALEELKNGNERYVSDHSMNFEENAIRRQHTAIHGQFPIATVLACSDARMPVETLLDQGNGDVFVIRIAGNIVGSQVLGSIDFSLASLNVPLVVVLGHTKCGAIYSAVDAVYARKEFSPNLTKLLTPLLPLTFDKCQHYPNPSPDELEDIKDSLIIENVWKEMSEIIRSSDEVKERLVAKTLLVVGAVYDIQTGVVTWLGTHKDQELFINERF